MSNIRMIMTLHDNDFWMDMHLLGEFITNAMWFFDTRKLDTSLLSDIQYRTYLKSALVDLLISIYKLRLLADPHSGVNLSDYSKNVDHVSKWFNSQFELYFTEDEFDKAMSFISSGSLSKHWSEIKYLDEFQMCDGNYEFLIIHCCDWENKFIII